MKHKYLYIPFPSFFLMILLTVFFFFLVLKPLPFYQNTALPCGKNFSVYVSLFSMSEDTGVGIESEAFRKLYRVLRRIGKGSFGEAYLVRSHEDGKRYVAKTVDIASMTEKEKKDVQNEIRILGAVKHPNIIRYREHFMIGTYIFIVMEYADGGDLSSRIKAAKSQEKPALFDPFLAMFWFLQICMALKYLHDNRILHRDLKTANIFLTSKNVVKLGDFGISTVLQTTMACAKTVCGTPYYFSPELCESRPYNNKSDVWALGVVFYEALTLQRPFNARSLKELLIKIKAGQFDPLPESIPLEIRQLCCSLLQVNPAQRPNVNRIIECNFVQTCLLQFSEELERQAEKDRQEFEKSKANAPTPKKKMVTAPAPASPPPPAEKPPEKQPATQLSVKEQMAALRRLSGEQRKKMLEQMPEEQSAPDEKERQKPTDESGAPEVDDDGEYIAQKKDLAKQTRDLVGQKGIDSHPEEFGGNENPSAAASFGGDRIVMPSGEFVSAKEGREAISKAMTPELLLKSIDLYNRGALAGWSSYDLERELCQLVGPKYSYLCNAISQLAILESKG